MSCTVIEVQDSMDDGEDSIEASWRFVSHALRYGAGVAVHLSKLRARGTENGKGLVASGPVSFGKIYSCLNEQLRRGGVYKNGAVVLHCDIDHGDILEFVTTPRHELPWAKRCVNVTTNLWNDASDEVKDEILKGIARGDIWLAKIRYDQHGEGTSLKSQLWNHDIGGWGWGNNESQYYRPDNTSIQEGHLVITAKEEAFGGKSYTSSRIKTEGSRTFTYGRVDIRAALPRGQGIWPALWALGENFADVGWPYSGEIDIMEMIGGQGREAEVHGTVHWNRGGLGAPYSHTYIGGKTRKAVGDFADGFNVFSLVRTEDQIEWYVNDELYYSFAINDSADLAPFRKPFFLIFNIAVGGNWPGYPDASTQFPQHLVVDYVRVFDAVTDSPGECNPCFPNSGESPSSGEAASRFSQLTKSVTSIRDKNGSASSTTIRMSAQAKDGQRLMSRDGVAVASPMPPGTPADASLAASPVSIPAVTPVSLAFGVLTLIALVIRYRRFFPSTADGSR